MKKRILTGYRPTGKLHLGHWFGNLQNMLEFQQNYECLFFIADWHALTSEWENTKVIPQYTEEMVLDWCAAGLEPEKCAIYRQSDIPEVSELNLYFAMITPMTWLERVPTYKEQQEQIQNKDLSNVGFFQYPMLMASDIVVMDAGGVPVGEDQLPHLELTRELVRRFNFCFGEHTSKIDGSGEENIEQILVEPEGIIAKEGARVPGLDGRKMSKSYGNAIFISDTEEEMRTKAMQCMTDPARKLKTDPGDPKICPLHQIHKLLGARNDIAEWEDACINATCGCVAHKKAFAEDLIKYFAPFSARRQELSTKIGYAKEVLCAGAAKARPIAQDVIKRCRVKLNLDLETLD